MPRPNVRIPKCLAETCKIFSRLDKGGRTVCHEIVIQTRIPPVLSFVLWRLPRQAITTSTTGTTTRAYPPKCLYDPQSIYLSHSSSALVTLIRTALTQCQTGPTANTEVVERRQVLANTGVDNASEVVATNDGMLQPAQLGNLGWKRSFQLVVIDYQRLKIGNQAHLGGDSTDQSIVRNGKDN